MKTYLKYLIAAFVLALCLALLISCGGTAEKRSEPLTEEDITKHRRGVSLSGAVFFDGIELFYDEGTNTYLWSADPEHYADGTVPEVRVDGLKDAELFLCAPVPGPDGIAEGRSFEFLIYNKRRYFRGEAVITTLPIVQIKTSDQIGDDYAEMSIRVCDNGAVRCIESECLVKVRGGTTRAFPKKSLRVSLKKESMEKKNKVSLLGMRDDDDWILYADYNDHEKVRNVFCSNLWADTCGYKNSKGVRNGSEYRFVELFVGNAYWGLYALGNPIDKKEMISDGENAVLYKKQFWSDELADLASDKPHLSYYDINKAEGKFENNEELSWKLLHDYYQYLADNADDSEKLLQGIDADNFIHLSVYLNFVQGADNGAGNTKLKNAYLCLTEGRNGITSIIAPWDMDLTLGNIWNDDREMNNIRIYGCDASKNMEFKHGYFGQIMKNGDTDLADRVKECYRELRNDSWSDESMNILINRYESEIYGSGAFVRDKERWPDGSYNEAEEGLSVFRRYVMDRLKACDEYYGI